MKTSTGLARLPPDVNTSRTPREEIIPIKRLWDDPKTTKGTR
jgi:hypothetical protein